MGEKCIHVCDIDVYLRTWSAAPPRRRAVVGGDTVLHCIVQSPPLPGRADNPIRSCHLMNVLNSLATIIGRG